MKKELDRVTPELVGLSSTKLMSFIGELEESGTEMHGLMVARHGKVAAECWWTPFSKDIPHVCHSFGKSYTATAVGVACTEGKLDVEEKLTDLFAEDFKRLNFEPDDNFKKLTVHNVLSMGNGMAQMPSMDGDWIDNYLTHKVDYEPGTRFLYNSVGSCLLSVIVQRRVGEGIKEYLTPRLFDKIGIETDKLVWLKFRNGYYAEPGVFSTTENNLRLAMLYMNNGKWEGEQLLSEAWLAKATSLQVDSSEDMGIPDCKFGYGYQLWMCSVPGVYRFDGGQGQYCLISPKDDLIVAINEGASYPSSVQKTLDIAYKYFFHETLPNSLDEDKEAHAKLVDVMRSRQIEKPAVKNIPSGIERLSGTYQVTEGDPSIWFELRPDGKPINLFGYFYSTDDFQTKKISIGFEDGFCKLQYNDDLEIKASLRGEYRVEKAFNIMPELDLETSTAYFEDENTLVVETRWIHFWCKIKSVFRFSENGVKITVHKSALQDAMPVITKEATASKV